MIFPDFDAIFVNLPCTYKEQAIFKRNLLFVWPIYTINALVIRILKITNMGSLVVISADSVPSSYLVGITIAPIGTTFGNLQ